MIKITLASNAAVRQLSVIKVGKRGGAGLFSIGQSWSCYRHFAGHLHMRLPLAVTVVRLEPSLGCTSSKIFPGKRFLFPRSALNRSSAFEDQ